MSAKTPKEIQGNQRALAGVRSEMATAKKTQTNRLDSVAGPPPTGSHAESIQMQSALIDRTA